MADTKDHWKNVRPGDGLDVPPDLVLSEKVWDQAVAQIEQRINTAASGVNNEGRTLDKFIPDIV